MVYKILIKKYRLKRIVQKKMKKPNYYIPRIYAKFFAYFFVNLVFIIYISYFSVIDLRFRATAQIFFYYFFVILLHLFFVFFSDLFVVFSSHQTFFLSLLWSNLSFQRIYFHFFF